jgi:adenylate cyclase
LRYLFENCALDIDRRELHRGPKAVSLEPQVFDLLVHLIRHRDRVVSKDDLLDTIWKGRAVSESALFNRINAARKAIGDTGDRQRLIKTLPRKGLRFVGEVREEAQRSLSLPDLPLPDRPSIAVLPFADTSGDPGREYFADGISEDLVTGLARIRWLFVIARNSTFVYKGKAVDVRQVARELGVRYVLEGSVRTAGQHIRITCQLVEAESGKHIWAEKYDRELRDIFAVQDDIAHHVLAAVEPHLYAEEGSRVAGQQPESIGTWGLVVRALTLLNKVERKQNREAQDLLQRAIAMEPGYARAHALLGWAVWWSTHNYWYEDRQEGFRQAARHAQDALSYDPSDPWARMVSGLWLSTGGQHEHALDELVTALRLNPSFALGSMAFAWALLRAGHFDDAIAESERALRMSPLDSFSGFYTAIHGLALLAARRFDEALPFLRASVAAFAEYAGHLNTLISCCGHLGLLEEAQEFIAARQRVGPPLRLSVLRHNLRNFAHCDVFIEGLKKAGVPE